MWGDPEKKRRTPLLASNILDLILLDKKEKRKGVPLALLLIRRPTAVSDWTAVLVVPQVAILCLLVSQQAEPARQISSVMTQYPQSPRLAKHPCSGGAN